MAFLSRSFLGRNCGILVLHGGLMTAAIFELGLSLSLPENCIFGRESSLNIAGRGGVCDLSKAMSFISLLSACLILFFAWWSAQNQYFKVTLGFYKGAIVGVLLTIVLWIITSILVTVYLRRTCQGDGGCQSLNDYSLGAWVVAASWVNTVLWFMALLRYLRQWSLARKGLDYDEEDDAIEEELREEQEAQKRKRMEKEEAELRRRRALENQLRSEREREDQLVLEQMRLQQDRDEMQRRRAMSAVTIVGDNNDGDEQLRRAAMFAENERIRRELELQKAKLDREAAERAARLAEEDRARSRALAEEERLRNLRFEEDRLRREREDRERAARLAEEDRQRAARWAEEDKLRRERVADAQRESDRILARAKDEEARARRRQEQEEQDRLMREREAMERERARLAAEAEADRQQRAAERARQDEEAAMRAEQLKLAAEADRQRQEAARLAELGRLEESNRAEAARLAAMAEGNRLAQQQLLAEAERTAHEEAEKARAKQAREARGDVTPKVLNVPKIAFNTLQQAKPRIEAETKTTITLQNTATVGNCTINGGAQPNVDEAGRRVETLINEEIRKDFGQQFQKGDAEPEYMQWLKGKRTNMVIALSKIYDKYPQVLQIKRTFDSVDSHEGISRGYLDKQQFINSFETLFPMCRKGFGTEYAQYMYSLLDEDGDGEITWKEFIFYCLSQQLIVLKPEVKDDGKKK